MNKSRTFFETAKNFSITGIRKGIAATALSGSLLLLSGCGEPENISTPEPTIAPTEQPTPHRPTEVPDDDKMICPQADSDHPDCLNNPN